MLLCFIDQLIDKSDPSFVLKHEKRGKIRLRFKLNLNLISYCYENLH